MSAQRDLLEMATSELTALGMAAALTVLTRPDAELPQGYADLATLFSEVGVSLPDVKKMPMADVGRLLDDVTERWATVLSGAVLVARLCALVLEQSDPGLIEPHVREMLANTLAKVGG